MQAVVTAMTKAPNELPFPAVSTRRNGTVASATAGVCDVSANAMICAELRCPASNPALRGGLGPSVPES